jgi:cell division protein FtsB
MIINKLKLFALGTSFALLSISLPASAQTTNDQSAGTADAHNSKQAQKAQKKAERKARRDKKNAELSKLEKNGYNPAGDQKNYPQDLQNAEKKANGQKATTPPSQ